MHGRAVQRWGGKRREEREREREREKGQAYTLGPSSCFRRLQRWPSSPSLPSCLPDLLPSSHCYAQGPTSLVLRTGNRPNCHLRWLVAKHCCMLKSKTRACLTPLPPREASFQLENTITHDTRRSIKAIDQRLFTPTSLTHTSIVSKVYGESESPPV